MAYLQIGLLAPRLFVRKSLPGLVRLDVVEREKHEIKENEAEAGPSEVALAAERALRELAGTGGNAKLFLPPGAPCDNDIVLSVVLVEEDEWWIGYHLHSRYHRPWPGGVARIELPRAAPSRAYLKLLEGLSWPGLPIRKGETALELGSAPGGASFGLLERGLSVLGVDPADMSRAVLENPAFRHIRLQAKQLRMDEVGPVDWLFSDMNIAPDEALDAVEKLMAAPGGMDKGRLLGALLTLKLTNWKRSQDIPELVRKLLERILVIGFAHAQAAQLYYNRHEICVACFTPLGLERISKTLKPAPSARLHESVSKARKKKF
ncbi:MAG: hypothetical protein HY074_00650 [Deltaproteobacteria bacterium]|nr:hypothetical protein [Deltaproteobacteria bacterium]